VKQRLFKGCNNKLEAKNKVADSCKKISISVERPKQLFKFSRYSSIFTGIVH